MEDMEITVYLSIVSFFYILRIYLELLLASKAKKNYKFLNFNNILDIIMATVFLIRFIREYQYYEHNLEGKDAVHKAVQYYWNVQHVAGDEILLDVIYSIGVGCLWMRILFSLRLTRFLGPLIKMITNMLLDIAIFMLLYGIVLIIFASVGNLMFVELTDYKDFYHSMLTLF